MPMNSGCSIRLPSAEPDPSPPLGISHPCPLPSCATSCDPILEKLPKLACITETRRTDPASVTSTAPKYFLHLSPSQTQKQAGQQFPALLSRTEGKPHLEELFLMAASSSATGKAAGEGYIPTGAAWGPCAPSHPPTASATTSAGSQTASLAGSRKHINNPQIKPH